MNREQFIAYIEELGFEQVRNTTEFRWQKWAIYVNTVTAHLVISAILENNWQKVNQVSIVESFDFISEIIQQR